jgi:hypothetical protein
MWLSKAVWNVQASREGILHSLVSLVQSGNKENEREKQRKAETIIELNSG